MAYGAIYNHDTDSDKMTDETKQWLEDTRSPDYHIELKKALGERGISQAEFAKQCGCSASNISVVLRRKNAWDLTPKYVWQKARVYLDPGYSSYQYDFDTAEREAHAYDKLRTSIMNGTLHCGESAREYMSCNKTTCGNCTNCYLNDPNSLEGRIRAKVGLY